MEEKILVFLILFHDLVTLSCISCFASRYCSCTQQTYSDMIVYMHELSLHKHSPGRFLTTLDLHVQILDALFLLCRCTMRLYASRIAGASPYLIPVFLSFLPSCYFLILIISDSVVISVFIYMISCVDAYMWYCSNHDLLQLGFIACFGLLKA